MDFSSSSSTSDEAKYYTSSNGKPRHQDARQSGSKRNAGKKKQRKGDSTTITSLQQQQPIYMEVDDSEFKHELSDFTSSCGSSSKHVKGNDDFPFQVLSFHLFWEELDYIFLTPSNRLFLFLIICWETIAWGT